MSASQFRVLPRQKTDEKIESDRMRRQVGKTATILLFLLPGLFIFVMFLLLPVARTARYSLHKWNGLEQLGDETYTGLGNYERLKEHEVFHQAIQHSFLLVTLSVGVQLPLALGLALLVGRGNLPGRKFFRTIFFAPFVFSEVITAIMWTFVYHPFDGLMNTILHTLTLGSQAWLGSKEYAIYAVFVVITWKYFGLYMILYMAALQNVPKELEEAARLDGASEVNLLYRITIPLISPTLRLTVYLSVLGSLQQFVLVWVMTQGGPVSSTELITSYLYKFGITRSSLGYGSAVSVVLFLIALVFSVGYQRIIMRQDYAGNDE